MLYWGFFRVKRNHRMACIDANLDDLQAGLDACSRAADMLQTDTERFNGFLKGSLMRSVLRHLKDLQACAHDQYSALRELRNSIAGLREELKTPERSVRPPPFERAKPPDPRTPRAAGNNDGHRELASLAADGPERHSSPRRSR
jgi:hypothetical protein